MGGFGAGTTKLFLLGAMVFLAAGTASAETFGSASIVTLRNCAVANACVFNGPALAVQEKGGLRQNVSDYRDFGGGSVSAGYVNFDSGFLPTIGTYASAGTDRRTGANFFSFRSYTWNGADSIDLALKGDLHFTTSGDLLSGEFAGEGNLNATLSIVGMDYFTSLGPNPTSGAIQRCNFNCGTPFARGSATSLGVVGEGTTILALSSVRLDPGDQFVVLAGIQTFANRGGWIDALNTFEVQLDLDNTRYVASGVLVGEQALQQSITSVVPEPATWAMLIIGFGMVGAVSRNRRTAAVSA